ncbi:MAG: cytochrome-c oxidase, cbb3-type subunit III [Rhodospirillales bacterium]|nr:cytochrome-c oxidase, cbb3-type subunit III [Rhodospirillales bacterium]MCB9980571.1 cytochrome-c oxidase, cbb3-type subunit III [Rhodospirillales bacterium]
MTNEHKKDVDHISGVETTGHEWDGLKELNNPLPRWWVWVWLVSIIWSIWYFVVYPAWPVPGGATEGTSGYSQYKELSESQNEIHQRQAVYLGKFEQASFKEVLDDPELYAFAVAGGRAAFKDNCAMCHGTGAEGGFGYPNLNDDDWLWGGKIDDIHTTLQYGIRAGNDDTRVSQMPAFGKDGLLNKEEINEVVEYVLALSKGEAQASMPGYTVFQENCAACHGEKGTGGREVGAPNLTDSIWLYGGTKEAVYETVYNAHAGVMPAWGERLDKNTIRQLAIYVHELGGGEEDTPVAEVAVEDVVPVLNVIEVEETPEGGVIEDVEQPLPVETDRVIVEEEIETPQPLIPEDILNPAGDETPAAHLPEAPAAE